MNGYLCSFSLLSLVLLCTSAMSFGKTTGAVDVLLSPEGARHTHPSLLRRTEGVLREVCPHERSFPRRWQDGFRDGIIAGNFTVTPLTTAWLGDTTLSGTIGHLMWPRQELNPGQAARRAA